MYIAEAMNNIELTENQFAGVISELEKKGYSPLFRKTSSEISKICGTPIQASEIFVTQSRRSFSLSKTLNVELFFRESSVLYLIRHSITPDWLYLMRHNTYHLRGEARQINRKLSAGVIGRGSDCSVVFDKFLTDTTESVKSNTPEKKTKDKNLEWARLDSFGRSLNHFLDSIKGKGIESESLRLLEANFSAEELESAALLSDELVRKELQYILDKGRLRLSEAGARMQEERSAIDRLISHGLLKKEHLICCHKSGKTLTHVANLDDISKGAIGLLPCADCGNKFSDERLEVIILPTDAARQIMTGSKWMNIWLTSLLEKNHIPRKNIRWNLSTGEGDIDVIASIHGAIIFFELKDREFGLGDAHSFGYRVERYAGDYGMVVTTDRVSKEAKKHLEERSDTRSSYSLDRKQGIFMVEGLKNAAENIGGFVFQMGEEYLSLRLSEENPYINLKAIISASV